jgi:hypothetical protein
MAAVAEPPEEDVGEEADVGEVTGATADGLAVPRLLLRFFDKLSR